MRKGENLTLNHPTGGKGPLWTKERISQLIELYKKHEYLWNHWHESYKCKVKRNRAIEEICSTLRISKFDFGRKIHNLRNQFNTEMKKLEQRVKEAGESMEELQMRCKWIHFESLMFLRDVIEPRPGGYQSSYPPPKKMRLRYNSEDDVNVTILPVNHSDSMPRSVSSSVQQTEQDLTQYEPYEQEDTEDMATEEYQEDYHISDDQKYQPISVSVSQSSAPTQTIATVNTRTFVQPTVSNPKITQITRKLSSQSPQMINHQISNEDPPIIELNGNNNVRVISTPSTPSPTKSSSTSNASSNTITSYANGNGGTSAANSDSNTIRSSAATIPKERDEWDAFGELVATEFRNLNSDISRKKLKRKIMQAMLQVGEEDDDL